MTKKILFTLAIFAAFDGHSQTQQGSASQQQVTSATGEDKTYSFVEQMPTPGFNINEYLAKNIKYPKKARRNGVQGRVVVQFVVSELGDIEDVNVLRSLNPQLDKEAIRVIKNMPRWKPGKQNGKAVKVRYKQPIAFRLE